MKRTNILQTSSLLIWLLAGILFGACNQSEEAINEKCGSGVVLIKNQGYYELSIPNGGSIYFTNYSKEEGLVQFTINPDSIVPFESYGTGFFVSDKGLIATNHHVIAPYVSPSEVKQAIREVVRQVQTQLSTEYNQLAAIQKEIQQRQMLKYMFGQDYTEESYTAAWIESQMEAYRRLYQAYSSLNIAQAQLKLHNKIDIAYNDSYIKSEADFHSCNLVGSDEKHDLALIQLADGKTPQGRYIFPVSDTDPLEDYSIWEQAMKTIHADKNQRLVMIGYNLGPVLAVTNQGIKAQYTSGSISQKDEDRILYSIPALHGSSGSPVINARGQLVAIQYAGLDKTQSFNYGIRSIHLRRLIDEVTE